ncbi:hypothetical protein Vadar_027833 [Vaccinium darrowii]|uniref:Uncharacterized protein n=1 Tax=Vaccinium darrowii TaxID=229202 RepID=A0ACB7X482_9ERIC|nr:hypothetical protein Vadar_027833 [Vaccinium darrowii]
MAMLPSPSLGVIRPIRPVSSAWDVFDLSQFQREPKQSRIGTLHFVQRHLMINLGMGPVVIGTSGRSIFLSCPSCPHHARRVPVSEKTLTTRCLDMLAKCC